MRRLFSANAFLLAFATLTSVAFCQTADPLNGTNATGVPGGAGTSGVDQTANDRSANTTSELGTSNPLSSGTVDNPSLASDPALRAIQPTNDRVPPGTVGNADPNLNNSNMNNSVGVQNDWRMVQHNGRWWYWTPNNTWLYRRGDQWMAYMPQGTDQRVGTGELDQQQQYRAGYRGDGTMKNEAMIQNEMNLRSGVADSRLQTQIDPRTGLGTNSGLRTNANTSGFEATRPLSPTADELQGFYRQQVIQGTPYGGTAGGARNATPLGGGTIRSGTGATGPATFGMPQTTAPGASPVTSSPGNPGAIGSPGNPSASGEAGTGAGTGSTTPAGGAGGAAGGSGSGSGGAGGSGS